MHIPVGFLWRLTLLGALRPAFRSSFTLFESGQVRPLALTPDGSTLLAVNTPDNRLEVFRILPYGLHHRGAVMVGLEPVAVAARTNEEIWVVNHLSDSVSVVRLQGDEDDAPRGERAIGRVVRTLLMGDEPRDIVFGGARRDRAFITTAHRGQHTPFNGDLTTPGLGRADVWVFDVHQLGSTLGGTPLTVVTLFTDTPRALAVTPDGQYVYAAGFLTGNRTTTLEFIPIKPLAATDSSAPGSCAGHNRVPSRDHGYPPSTGASGLSQCDTA